ncbi:MAG: hypothetical protein AB1716_17675 [Planctomycetota bacterium]
MIRIQWWVDAAAVALTAATLSAGPIYSFDCITNNRLEDAAIGEAQLFMDVYEAGLDQVGFRFFNTGPAASSITGVYFDDGALLGIAYITNGQGVDFAQWASPPNLPGGHELTPPFVTTAGFLADSNPPVQLNGVNPGEQLWIVFDLKERPSGGRYSWTDVLWGLNHPLDEELGVRVGIKVQGFDSGGSESFVNNLDNPIPAPAAVGLAGLGITLAGWMRRRLA